MSWNSDSTTGLPSLEAVARMIRMPVAPVMFSNNIVQLQIHHRLSQMLDMGSGILHQSIALVLTTSQGRNLRIRPEENQLEAGEFNQFAKKQSGQGIRISDIEIFL